MALSGSFTKSINSYLSIKVTWTATQSIANNTSTVNVKAYAVRGAYGYNTAISNNWTLYIDGTAYTGTGSFGGANNSQTLLASQSKTITHGSDGTRSFAISFAQTLNITFSGIYIGTVYTGDYAFSLNHIPRASTWVTAPSFSLGSNPTVAIKINSSSYTHNIDLFVGASEVAQWTGIKSSSNTLTFTSAQIASLQNHMGNNTSISVIWGLETYDGSKQVGSTQWKTVTLTMDAGSSAPTINSITYTETNSTAKAMESGNQVVQGLSAIQVNVSASAKSGASISSIVVTADSVDYTVSGGTVTLAAPTGTDTYTIYTTVTDSRGFTTSTSQSFSIITYAKPMIQSAIATRSNSSGVAQSDGQNIAVTYSVATNSLAGSGITTNITYQVATSDTPSSSWSTGASRSYSGNSATDTVTLPQTFQGTSPYYIRLVVTDAKGGSSVAVLAVGTAQVLMSWSKSRVGIGKVAQNGVLDVGGDLYVSGNQVLSGDINMAGSFTANRDIEASQGSLIAGVGLQGGTLSITGNSTFGGAINTTSGHNLLKHENVDPIYFSWGSGWSPYANNSSNVSLNVDGNTAVLSLMFTHSNALGTSTGTICTIPNWVLPAQTTRFCGVATNGRVSDNFPIYGSLSTSGVLTASVLSTGAREANSVFIVSFTYICNDRL